MILIPDVETTSQSPGQICQLAWLEAEGNTICGHNLFFRVDSMSETSQAIHGFSLEQLEALSGGKTFADHAPMLLETFSRADEYVGHNISADLRFLRAEFERLGVVLPEHPTYCTMIHGTPVTNLRRKWNNRSPKPPRLNELCEHFGLTPEMISARCAEWFGCSGQAHDARYDAAATLLCYRELTKE